MSLYDVLMGRQQQLNSANNSLADIALSRAEELNSYKAKAVEDLVANKKSLVGEFSQGGFLDTAVATGASLITQTGNGLASALEMHNANNETDPIKAAQTRLAAKKIRDAMNMDSLVGINPDTGERTSSLHRRVLGNAAVIAGQGSAAALQGLVGIASIPTLGWAGQKAEELGFRPKEGIAALEEYLTPEMRAVNQRVEAADGFTATAGEMLDNPSSIASGIVKSVPSMLLGGGIGRALGLVKGISAGVAGALGEGAIMAGSQAEGIREETKDGRLSLKQALYAAGTGVMGAGVGVLGNRLAGKLRVGDIDEALVTGTLAKTPRGMPSSMLLSGGLEGGEELLQSSGETALQNLALNKPFDENLGDAAAMGLLTGAPMGALAGTSTSAAATAKDTASKNALRDASIQTNDVSAYLNPESPQKDPVEAMKVWTAHAELETTTPEVRRENLKQSDALLTSLEDSWTQAVTISKILKATPEQRAGFEAQAVALKAEIADLDQTDTATVAAKTAELATIEQGLAIEPSILARQRQVGEVARRTKELNDSMRIHERLGDVVRGRVDAASVASDLVTAKAPVDPQDQPAVQASQAAAERLINLSMVSSTHLDDSTAMSLANDTQNGLSAPQRDYLRQFSAARVAQNALETTDSVSKTILDGDDKGNLGLKQYKLRIGNALDSQNKTQALHYLDLLSKFSSGHAEKAKVGAATLAQAIKEDRTLQMIPGSTPGSWVTVPKAKWIDDLVYMRSIGGLAVHPNSDKSKKTILVMPSEVTAIDQALLAHASAYQLKFGAFPPGITLPTVTAPVAQAPSPVATSVTPVNTSVAPVQKTGKSIQVIPAPTFSDVFGITAKPDLVNFDMNQLGEVSVDKVGNSKVLGMTTTSSVRLVDGTVVKVNIAGNAIQDGQGTVIDAGLITAFKNEGNGTQWIPVKSKAAPVVPAVESPTSLKTPVVSVASPKQAEGNTRPDPDKAVTAVGTSENVFEETARLEEVTRIEKEIKRVEKAQRKQKRQSMSLWSALKHSLSESALVEVYGSGWKKYTLLKGKPGVDLSTRVANGDLDAYLPFKLNSQAIEADGSLEQEAVQYIKDRLGSQDYLTEETKHEMDKLGLTIEELEQQLTLLDIQKEIDYAEAEIAQDNETTSEQDQEATGQEPAGSAAAPVGKEEATTGTGSDVATKTPEQLRQEKLKQPLGKLILFEKYNKDLPKKLKGVFTKINLVAQFFEQVGVSATNATNRPLVAVKDFLSAWNDKEVHPVDFLVLEEGTVLTAQEETALNHFQRRMNNWMPSIKATLMLRPKPAEGKADDYVAEDMLQYLYQDENTAVLEENVLLAIGQSAYSFIVDMVNKPMFLKEKEMVKMQGFRDGTKVNSQGLRDLGRVTGMDDTVLADLGKRVIQALGFKAKDTAPVDLMPKLEIALGRQVLELLIKKKYVTIETKQTMLVNAYFTKTTGEINEIRQGLQAVMEVKKEGYKKGPVFDQAAAFRAKYAAIVKDAKAKKTAAGDLEALQNDVDTTADYVVFKFEKTAEGQTLTALAQEFKDANRGSSEVLSKLFGIEHAPRLPSTKPQTFKQDKAKNTKQDIPKKLWQAIQNSMRKPHTAIPEMVSVALGLGVEGLALVAGKKATDSGLYHSTNVASIEAQNDNILNQIQQMFELFDRDGYQATWFSVGEVWKNFRAGISNSAMNLQSSKVHRAMFKQASWTVTIDPKKEPELLKEFMITVAMGLGEKTDQQRNVTSLEKYFTLENGVYFLKNEKMLKAASALQAIMNLNEDVSNDTGNEWDQETKDLVINATKGEGMMSLQALVAYSKYLNAMAQQKESFEFTLLTGADGKTNGPMLTLLALGAAEFDTLNRGGMYRKGEANHFSEWFENEDSQDLYQDTGRTVVEGIQQKMFAVVGDVPDFLQVVRGTAKNKQRSLAVHPAHFEALQGITGKLFTNNVVSKVLRNLVKTPLTAFFFGSSTRSAVESMEDAFVLGFYTKLQDIKAKEVENKAAGLHGNLNAYSQFVADTNTLFDLGRAGMKSDRVPQEFNAETLDVAMVTELSTQQEEELRKAFQLVMGNSVANTLDFTFGEFAVIRTTLNKTVQAAWETYHAAYSAARKKEMQRLIESGEVESRMTHTKDKITKEVIPTGILEPIHDLNANQLAVVRLRVKHLLPILHSAYSREEGNINAGLGMGKTRTTKAKEVFYSNNNFYNKSNGDGTTSRKSSKAKSQVREETGPGVTPTSFSIHSLDSAIMHEALLEFENSLNVHDELATSVRDMAPAATAINKAVVDKLLNYSPMREGLNMLQRMILGMAQEVAQNNVDKDTVATMFQSWADAYNRGLFGDDQLSWEAAATVLLNNAFDTALTSDQKRLNNLSQLYVMDQYTWEGGQYNVPESVREAARDLRNNLPTKLDPKVVEALNMLKTFAATGKATAAAEEVTSWVEDTDAVVVPTMEQLGLKGVLASEVIALIVEAHPELLKAMETMTVEAALASLSPLQRADVVQAIMTAKKKLVGVTPWGKLADPKKAPAFEQPMLDLFANNDTITSREVITALNKQYSGKGGLNAFYTALLTKVALLVPNLPVQIIRANTATNAVLPEALTVSNSKGWYTVGKTGKAIYVLSPEFKHSGLTAELMLHELLHAALSQAIANGLSINGRPAAKALVAQLQGILDQIKAKGLAADFKQVFDSNSPVDELVSWGLTNAKFQKMLQDLEMPKAVKKTGMSEFLTAITDFFFRGGDSKKNAKTGMATLLASVSGLFEEAAKGSEQAPRNLSMAAQINAFTTTEVHDALDEGKVSPAFNEHLKDILNTIVDKLHGPANAFKDAIAKGVAATPGDVFNEAISTGVAPFTSELQASGFLFNNQTFFVAEQVEATVKALLDSKDNKMAAVREELRKLEAEVRGKLKPQDFFEGDWFQATKDEREQATALHNYLFKNVNGDYLARFAALGLSHEGFNALLKAPTKLTPVTQKDRSIEGNLTRLFSKMLNAVNGKFITHTRAGQPADDKLAALVRQLVEIENRNKNTLKSPLGGIIDFADNRTKAARQGGKDVLSSILDSGMFMKSRNKTVAAASSVVGIIANNEVRYLFQNAITLRNSVYKEKLGVIASAIAEMNGPPKALLKLLREGKAHLEGGRKDIISLTKASVMESFKDKGKYLSEVQKKAVTTVLLRTGAHVLLKAFDMKQMASLVTDQAVLDKAIADYESKISGIPLEIKSHLIHQSKTLSYHLVSGRSMSATVKLNAHNIVHMKEMVYEGRLSDAQTAALIPVIDSLVSLYALSYTSPTSKIALGTVMEVENIRTDGNGLQMVMLTQQHAEEMALSRLFHDSPVLMVKGYLPEIYNPHTDIRAANHEEGEKLMNLGYKLVGPLSLDPNDPFSEPQNLYVLRNGGMLPWLSGLFSFTNMRSKGTQNHGDNARGTQAILSRNAGRGKVAVGEGEAFDPRINQVDYMTATVNMDGVAVNARYMMHSTTKDGLLERENRFDEVLGALKGSIFDKEESKVHNEKAVQVLYEDFKEGFTKKSTLYLEVSATSTDPELREIWKMLPQSTKDAVKEIWGKEAMMVRPENLDIAFGYRKLSISSRFSRDVVDQTVIDKAMIGFVSLIMKTYGRTIKGMTPEQADKFAMSNAVTVRRLESMVQEIMHEVKDIYVVKNVITSLNNIKSNLSLLLLYGVNPIKGLRDMRIAWVGAEEHQRDSAALFKLRQQLDTGYITGDTSEIEAEIKRLEEALSNNPVAKVIELGMMPSIVEDVSTEEDPYTYKAALALKMDKYKAKVNPKVLSVVKNIAMTKDTKVYQSLSRVVQLSDFVAKYAMYQHLTTRETDPMTEEAAAHAASEAFINYDVPMHRGLEYMDSVGAFMFTKYFLRVQRVIRGRIKHAPGKLVMLLAAESFLGDLPTIMDASIVLRAGNNPLQTGPLELLEALPQLPTLFWLPGR